MVESDDVWSVLKEKAATNAKVTGVFFQGVERTKKWVLTTELEPLLASTTFAQLVNNAYRTKVQMEKDGLFERVAVVVDADKSVDPIADGYQVTFLVHESNMPKGGARVSFSNSGEKFFEISGQGNNIFGAGESATAELSRGTFSSASMRFAYVKPLIRWRNAKVGVSAWRTVSQWPWCGLSSAENGASVDFTHWPVADVVSHQLKYLASWRNISINGAETPFSIRRFAGVNLKSSIVSNLTLDTRDDRILASKGVLLSLANELAGLGGDANFFRQEAVAQLSAPLPFDFTLSCGGRLTLVRPMGPARSAADQSSPLHVLDRAFLGGASDLRGFDFNSVGPEQDGTFLGGSASWCLTAHLFKRLWPPFILAHAFLGAGNIAPVGAESDWRETSRDLSRDPRLSAGLGLAFKIGASARFELNYCCPIVRRPTDLARHGCQFGIGVNFL